MGVFETLAEVCPPADLARIRDGMREFLSTAGGGARENRRKLLQIAERLLPLERRYLPALNIPAIEKLPSETLVTYVRPDTRLHLLVTAVLRPRRVFALIGRGEEAEAEIALVPLQEDDGVRLVTIPLRGDDVQRECDRISERIQRERAMGGLVFFPNDGPASLTMALTICAQRFGAPVIYTEVETYAGVERPFSLRIHVLSQGGAATATADDLATPAPGAYVRASQPGRFAYPSESPVLGASRRGGIRAGRGGDIEDGDEEVAGAASGTSMRAVPGLETAPRPAVAAATPSRADAYAAPPHGAPAPAEAPQPTPPPVVRPEALPEPARPVIESGAVPAVEVATLLVDLFNERNYAAALRVADHIGRQPPVLRLFWVPADVLVELVRVYVDWDRFRHSPTVERPDRKLHDRLLGVWQRLGPARNKLVPDAEVSRNAAFLRALQTSWKPGGRVLGDSGRMVDYLVGGLRRHGRGHFDTAVACFARSLELAAIYLVHGPPFKLGDPLKPDLTRVLEIVGTYNELADRVNAVLHEWDRTLSMPTRDAPLNLPCLMGLLEVVGAVLREGPALAVGARFRELMTTAREGEPPLAVVLARAVSSGATSPLDEEESARMEKTAREIVSRAVTIDAFRKLQAAATHPSLSLPGGTTT